MRSLVMMMGFAILLAAAPFAATTPASPPIMARAQATAFVRIIQAAEVRGGRSDTPHQRRTRRDADGQPQLLLEFE